MTRKHKCLDRTIISLRTSYQLETILLLENIWLPKCNTKMGLVESGKTATNKAVAQTQALQASSVTGTTAYVCLEESKRVHIYVTKIVSTSIQRWGEPPKQNLVRFQPGDSLSSPLIKEGAGSYLTRFSLYQLQNVTTLLTLPYYSINLNQAQWG